MEALLSKLPRYVLILFTTGFFILTSMVGSYLWADSQRTKGTAYEARTIANTASMQVADLRGAIQDLKTSEEKDREESRQDFKELRELLLRPR